MVVAGREEAVAERASDEGAPVAEEEDAELAVGIVFMGRMASLSLRGREL